jgi:polyhydroxybutyrate depolymerase
MRPGAQKRASARSQRSKWQKLGPSVPPTVSLIVLALSAGPSCSSSGSGAGAIAHGGSGGTTVDAATQADAAGSAGAGGQDTGGGAGTGKGGNAGSAGGRGGAGALGADAGAQDGATEGGAGAQGGDAGADGGSLGCGATSTLKAGDNRGTLPFGGRSRTYVVYVPSSVDRRAAVPLVLDFHGSGGTGSQEESSSGWKKKADQVGFIVVYPDGVGNTWNVGNCCGQALSEKVDDVGFVKALIATVSRDACIDSKRVYATGFSNGAGLTERLGCEAADVLTAIAAASADLVTDPCTPARPISELAVRGLNDTQVAYAGGNTGSTGWYSPGAKATLELWKTIDRCTGSVTKVSSYCETYSSCADGTEVTLCSMPDTGHDVYNNPQGFKVPDFAWDMFQRHRLP